MTASFFCMSIMLSYRVTRWYKSRTAKLIMRALERLATCFERMVQRHTFLHVEADNHIRDLAHHL
jgi:hypothetical protein